MELVDGCLSRLKRQDFGLSLETRGGEDEQEKNETGRSGDGDSLKDKDGQSQARGNKEKEGEGEKERAAILDAIDEAVLMRRGRVAKTGVAEKMRVYLMAHVSLV